MIDKSSWRPKLQSNMFTSKTFLMQLLRNKFLKRSNFTNLSQFQWQFQKYQILKFQKVLDLLALRLKLKQSSYANFVINSKSSSIIALSMEIFTNQKRRGKRSERNESLRKSEKRKKIERLSILCSIYKKCFKKWLLISQFSRIKTITQDPIQTGLLFIDLYHSLSSIRIQRPDLKWFDLLFKSSLQNRKQSNRH